MSRAREILDERLARGEISPGEYEELRKQIAPEEPHSSAIAPSPHVTSDYAAKSGPIWPWFIPMIFVFALRFITGDADTNYTAALGPTFGPIFYMVVMGTALIGLFRLAKLVMQR